MESDPATQLVLSMLGHGETASESLEVILGTVESTLLKEGKAIASQIMTLQEKAIGANDNLQTSLDTQQRHLLLIDERTDEIIGEFDRALDGGLRIGERLAQAEASRQQVQYAEDVLTYITFFENCPREIVDKIQDSRSDDILTFLPPKLAKQSWLDISQVFHSLRRVLYDINTSDMKAEDQESYTFVQEIVIALCTGIEGVLLSIFEAQMMLALENPKDNSLIIPTREVVSALMLFNDGAALQKRYIFSVVASRFVRTDANKKKGGIGTKLLHGLGKTFKKAGAAVRRLSVKPVGNDDDSSSAGDEFDDVNDDGENDVPTNDDSVVAGAKKISDIITFGRYGSADDLQLAVEEEKPEEGGVFGIFSRTLMFTRKRAQSGVYSGEDSSEIMDKMSRLFAALCELFVEQLDLLSKVSRTEKA